MTKRPAISIATSFQYGMAIAQQIALIAEAGFSHISLGVRTEHCNYLDPAIRVSLKRLCEEHGLQIDSVHATRLDEVDASSKVLSTVEAAAELGAGCVVAHAGPFHCGTEAIAEHLQAALTTCEAMAPVLREKRMRCAIENVMPGPATDLVTAALGQLDTAVFGLCYDSAHDQIDGPRPFDLIHSFRDRIFAVHLSDRIKEHVDHVIPGEGFIDWSGMCTCLRQAHSPGPVLMEVMMQHSRYQEPAVFLKKAYIAALETWKQIHSDE